MKRISLGLVFLLAVACSGADESRPASSAKVIPHERLLELLPTLDGWTRGTPQGSTDNEEAVSRVQVDYTQPQGMGGLSIEIMDTTMNANILGPLTEAIKANRSEKSGDPNMPTTTTVVNVTGFPATQEWTPGVSNGALSILVANRFTVGVTGNSVSGPEVMRQAAESIDLKKLATLK